MLCVVVCAYMWHICATTVSGRGLSDKPQEHSAGHGIGRKADEPGSEVGYLDLLLSGDAADLCMTLPQLPAPLEGMFCSTSPQHLTNSGGWVWEVGQVGHGWVLGLFSCKGGWANQDLGFCQVLPGAGRHHCFPPGVMDLPQMQGG